MWRRPHPLFIRTCAYVDIRQVLPILINQAEILPACTYGTVGRRLRIPVGCQSGLRDASWLQRLPESAGGRLCHSYMRMLRLMSCIATLVKAWGLFGRDSPFGGERVWYLHVGLSKYLNTPGVAYLWIEAQSSTTPATWLGFPTIRRPQTRNFETDYMLCQQHRRIRRRGGSCRRLVQFGP